jgi:hypothetical protein
LLRVVVGKGMKENIFNDAEDGGVGADAESEGEYSDGGEAGGFAQHAEGVANILNECFEPLESPRGARAFFNLQRVAQCSVRSVGRLLRGQPGRSPFLGL